MGDAFRLAVVAGRPLNPWDVVLYGELERRGIHTTVLGAVRENDHVPTVPTVALRDLSPWHRLTTVAPLAADWHAFAQAHRIRYLPSPLVFDDATIGLRPMLRDFDAVVAIETYRASTVQACQAHPRTVVRVSENLPRNPPHFLAGVFRKSVARRAMRFVCQTNLARQTLREEGFEERKLVVVPETIDAEVFRPALRATAHDARPVVGFAGVLERRHGVLDLLDAFARVAQRSDAVLRIVGEGDLEPVLHARVSELGIADRVSFPGRLRYDQMPAFLQGLDVLCMPYRETPDWRPQFGVVNLEAMACGIPTLSTNAGAIPEVLPPGLRSLAAAPGDVPGLEERLHRLLNDSDFRAALGREAREWVLRGFDVRACAPAWVQLLTANDDAPLNSPPLPAAAPP